MKRLLTFIPLGIGISAAIIYIFNVVQFRVINNSATLLQILSNLKIYLYISIAGFLTYFLIKVLFALNNKGVSVRTNENDETQEQKDDFILNRPASNTNVVKQVTPQNDYNNMNTYVPNYDYVPRYKKENESVSSSNVLEEQKDDSNVRVHFVYCGKCGAKINKEDVFCRNCGARQKEKKSDVNPTLRSLINLLEIVILILILYFSVNMMFDYKESKDPNFKSPFNVSMTK